MVRGSEPIFLKRGHTYGQQTHETLPNITSQGKVNRNYNEISPHLWEWLPTKNPQITSVSEKGTLSYTVGRIVNWSNYCEEHYDNSSKKNKKELPYGSRNSTSRYLSEKTETWTQTDICSPNLCGSVGWVSPCKVKGPRSDSLSGHMPRLRVRSLAGACTWGNLSMFLSHIDVSLPLFLPSLPSLQKENK